MLISEGKTNKFGEAAKAGGHRGRGRSGTYRLGSHVFGPSDVPDSGHGSLSTGENAGEHGVGRSVCAQLVAVSPEQGWSTVHISPLPDEGGAVLGDVPTSTGRRRWRLPRWEWKRTVFHSMKRAQGEFPGESAPGTECLSDAGGAADVFEGPADGFIHFESSPDGQSDVSPGDPLPR